MAILRPMEQKKPFGAVRGIGRRNLNCGSAVLSKNLTREVRIDCFDLSGRKISGSVAVTQRPGPSDVKKAVRAVGAGTLTSGQRSEYIRTLRLRQRDYEKKYGVPEVKKKRMLDLYTEISRSWG